MGRRACARELISMHKVRVLTVTDLHLRRSLYDQLKEAVAEHEPDVVACVGDFLDAEDPIRRQDEKLSIPNAAFALSELPCEVVFTRGNHEDECWADFEQEWQLIAQESGKKLNALHGDSFTFGPLTMVGFPCWLGNDEYFSQGRPLGRYNPEAWLPNLLKQTGPAGRTLWLIHEPPSLEIAAYVAYEPEWRDAIVHYQPLVTVSGHDHFTPIRTGQWHTKIGDTVCINAGQRVYPTPGKLVYCLIDFAFPSTKPSLPTGFNFQRFS